MKSIKTLPRYSNELASQSVVALDQALKERLLKDVADAMDASLTRTWLASTACSVCRC